MTAPAVGYIPFDARLNMDGTVNIFADGNPLPGGQGLSTGAVLRILSLYAKENGTVLMTTVQLNGRVTRDLIDGSGGSVPYYVPAEAEAEAATEEDTAVDNEDVLLAALKTRGAVPGAAPAGEYVPQTPKARRVRPLDASEAIPDYDVEGDIRKAMATNRAPVNMRLITIVLIGILAAAVAAYIFNSISGSLSAADFPLPSWYVTDPPA